MLSAIICRIRDPDGTVPLVVAYDMHERVWQPADAAAVPAPRTAPRTGRIAAHAIRKLLNAAWPAPG